MRESDKCAACQETSQSKVTESLNLVTKSRSVKSVEYWMRLCEGNSSHAAKPYVAQSKSWWLSKETKGRMQNIRCLWSDVLLVSVFPRVSSYLAACPKLSSTKVIKKCVFWVFWISMRLRCVLIGGGGGLGKIDFQRSESRCMLVSARSHTHTHTE